MVRSYVALLSRRVNSEVRDIRVNFRAAGA